MEQFGQLEKRIDKLQQSIQISEAEQIELTKQNNQLKVELESEQIKERKIRHNFLKLERISIQNEIDTIEYIEKNRKDK